MGISYSYAWLKQVQQSGQSLDLHWYPFVIQMDDPIEYWKRAWDAASSERRGFIANTRLVSPA